MACDIYNELLPRLQHLGEFQHNYYTFGSVHGSNHDGIVRMYIGQPLITLHFTLLADLFPS